MHSFTFRIIFSICPLNSSARQAERLQPHCLGEETEAHDGAMTGIKKHGQ